jgi:hypothetical protein
VVPSGRLLLHVALCVLLVARHGSALQLHILYAGLVLTRVLVRACPCVRRAALRRGEGVNVHQRLIGAGKKGNKAEGTGTGGRTVPPKRREVWRAGNKEASKAQDAGSFLDSLNSY